MYNTKYYITQILIVQIFMSQINTKIHKKVNYSHVVSCAYLAEIL